MKKKAVTSTLPAWSMWGHQWLDSKASKSPIQSRGRVQANMARSTSCVTRANGNFWNGTYRKVRRETQAEICEFTFFGMKRMRKSSWAFSPIELRRCYWAKKEAGKPVKQVRFVETADPSDERVSIYGSNQADLPAPVREILQQARATRATRRPLGPARPATVANSD